MIDLLPDWLTGKKPPEKKRGTQQVTLSSGATPIADTRPEWLKIAAATDVNYQASKAIQADSTDESKAEAQKKANRKKLGFK